MGTRDALLLITKIAEVLDAEERKALPKSEFAVPKKELESGSYPIGTPEEKEQVRPKLHRKFPEIGKKDEKEKEEDKKDKEKDKEKDKDEKGEKEKEEGTEKTAGLLDSLKGVAPKVPEAPKGMMGRLGSMSPLSKLLLLGGGLVLAKQLFGKREEPPDYMYGVPSMAR